MKSRWPSKRRTLAGRISEVGSPKFVVGDAVGNFTIVVYMGHSAINKRNSRQMSKPQHWYRCRCTCGNVESHSQQELVDPRRSNMCAECKDSKPTEE